MALAKQRVAYVNGPIELERFLSRELVAKLVGNNDQTFAFNETSGETLIIDGSDDGGSTWTYFQRIFTFSTTGSAFANIAALLADINTAAKWDGSTLPTEFTVTNEGDKLVIKSTETGNDIGIRVNSGSTAIGATSNTDLLFTSGSNTTGGDGGSQDLETLIDIFPDNSGKYVVVYEVF